jgi:putative endopeptidase
MKIKRFSVTLAAALILAGCSQGSNKNTSSVVSSASSSPVTSVTSAPASSSSSLAPVTGEVIDEAKIIAENATRDGAAITAEELLAKAGYHGDEKLTKTRFFVLLFHAYDGKMPDLVGIRLLNKPTAVDYAEVPSEATAAVKFLNDFGILTPEYDSAGAPLAAFNGDEEASSSLISVYLDRFHAYFGTSLVDDFHNSVNADFLFKNATMNQKTASDVFTETNIVSVDSIDAWIKNKIADLPAGTAKTNVQNYLSAYYDESLKTAGNCSGAFKAYQAIASTSTYSELFSKSASLLSTSGIDPLFESLDTSIDTFNNENGSPAVELNPTTFVIPSDSLAEDSDTYKSMQTRFTAYFTDIGFAAADSAVYATSMLAALKKVNTAYEASVTAAAAQGQAPAKETVDAEKAVFGPQSFDLAAHFTSAGFTPNPFKNTNEGATGNLLPLKKTNNLFFNAYFDSMDDASFQDFRALALFNESYQYRLCNPINALADAQLASDVSYLDESRYFLSNVVFSIETNFLASYVTSSDYRNNCATVSKAITSLKEMLSARVANETWLSAEGKASCQRKIQNMRSSVLGTNDDMTHTRLDGPSFSASSLFDSYSAGHLNNFCFNLKNLGVTLSFDQFADSISPFYPNAFYAPNVNGLFILPGYLASHGDFFKMSNEKLFAHLYWAAGHEITHGFDSNGVMYDENGQQNENWLNAADKTAYQARTQVVIDLYNGYEVYNGLQTNGKVTISEDGADCAGLRLTLDAAKQVPGFDFKQFFKEAAVAFASYCTLPYYAYVANDVHPFGRARVNRAFSSMPEFYTAFEVKEGDGMYVEPAKRADVW